MWHFITALSPFTITPTLYWPQNIHSHNGELMHMNTLIHLHDSHLPLVTIDMYKDYIQTACVFKS